MEKSHVALGQHQCPVCFNLHDSGEILLDKRGRPSLNHKEVTGRSICPSCQEKKDQGYVALIECDERTRQPLGRLIHIREEVWPNIFNAPCPEGKICMVPSEVIDMIVAKAQKDGAL